MDKIRLRPLSLCLRLCFDIFIALNSLSTLCAGLQRNCIAEVDCRSRGSRSNSITLL